MIPIPRAIPYMRDLIQAVQKFAPLRERAVGSTSRSQRPERGHPREPLSCRATASCHVAFSQGYVDSEPIVLDARGDTAPVTPIELNDSVSFHGPQRARQVGFLSSREFCKLIDRLRPSLCDDLEKLTVPGRKHFGDRFDRGKPDLRLARRGTILASRDRHSPGLHLLVTRNPDLQRRHRFTPKSSRYASTSAQNAASKAAAFSYSYGFTVLRACR